ncbi:hypothetical protein SCALM49S_06025 [Streptomyces californicus]
MKKAKKIDWISFEDMLELAASGSKVLLHRCVEYARRYNIPIHVRSSFSGLRGTWVSNEPQGDQKVEHAIISGVAHDVSEAKVTVVGVPDKPGEAAAIFRAIADAEVNIDMVVQNVSAASTGLTDISFTLPKAEGRKAIDALERTKGSIGFDSLRYDDQIAKISLVGAGMKTNPGVTAGFFEALSDAGVNIELISTSEIRISVVTRADDVNEAVRAVHTPSVSTATPTRPSSTEAPADDRAPPFSSRSSVRPGRSAVSCSGSSRSTRTVWGEVRLVASPRSAGRRLVVRGEEGEVLALSEDVFDGIDVALFLVPDAVSAHWVPIAAAKGGRRRRRLGGLPARRRRAARRPRDQPPCRASEAARHRRVPELHHPVADRRGRRAARRVRAARADRLLLPGGQRRRPGRRRGPARAACAGGRYGAGHPARRRTPGPGRHHGRLRRPGARGA